MRRSLLLGRPWIGGWKLVALLSVGCRRGDGVDSLGKCRGEVLSEGGLQSRLQRELFCTDEGMTWLVTLCSQPRSKFLGFLRASGLGRGRHHLRAFVVCMCPNEQQRASWKGFRRKSVSLVLSICICASVGQQLTEQVVPASSQKGPMRPTLEVACAHQPRGPNSWVMVDRPCRYIYSRRLYPSLRIYRAIDGVIYGQPLIHLPTHACTSGVKPDTCMSPAPHVGRKPSLDVNNGGGSPTPFIRRGSRRTGCNLPRGVAGPRRDKTPVTRKA